MSVLRLIAHVFAVITLASCGGLDRSHELSREQVFSIYIFDFELYPYFDISTKNIEAAATCHVVLGSNSRPAQQIFRALKKVERGKFQDRWTRIKIITPDKRIVFVDLDGGVLFLPDNHEGRISEEAFLELQALIESDSVFESCLRR